MIFADAADTMDFGLDAALVEASGEPAAAGYARPVKSLLNLTTVVDSLAFSPDEQVTAVAVSSLETHDYFARCQGLGGPLTTTACRCVRSHMTWHEPAGVSAAVDDASS